MKKRILTGDRTTGKLHLGHYVGSLKSRVELQDDCETFILLADVQALTTHFSNPELIYSSIYDVALDNLAVGLDPEKITFVQQSQITSIAELTIFYSMLVSVNKLGHNPTIKTEAKNYGYKEMTYGFLGYPISQTADITFCNADLVPVGVDQMPHIEFSQQLVRKFNAQYGTNITQPQAKLSQVGRLCGLDGNEKMGKSLGNAVYLSDTKETVTSKIMKAVTDTNRISIKIPGNPDVCTVYKYHQVFNPTESENIGSMCRKAEIGCVACKKLLAKKMNEILDPIRERRNYFEERKDLVKDYIVEGSKKANKIGDENLNQIKEKMHILL